MSDSFGFSELRPPGLQEQLFQGTEPECKDAVYITDPWKGWLGDADALFSHLEDFPLAMGEGAYSLPLGLRSSDLRNHDSEGCPRNTLLSLQEGPSLPKHSLQPA